MIPPTFVGTMLAGESATQAGSDRPARGVPQVRETEDTGVEALPASVLAGVEDRMTAATFLAAQACLRAVHAGGDGGPD